MKAKLKISIAAWLLAVLALPSVIYSNCYTCRKGTLEISIQNGPNFSDGGMPLKPPYQGQDSTESIPGGVRKTYEPKLGERYIFRIGHLGHECAGGVVSVRGACGVGLYFREQIIHPDGSKSFPNYWQASTGFTVQAKVKTRTVTTQGTSGSSGSEPGGASGVKCSCEGCVGGPECRCCCYKAGAQNTDKSYTAYIQATLDHVDLSSNVAYRLSLDPNKTEFEAMAEVASGFSPEIWKGWADVGSKIAILKNTAQTRRVSFNSWVNGKNVTPDDELFIHWDEATLTEIIAPPTAEVLCECPPDSEGTPGQPSTPGQPGTPSTTRLVCEPGEEVEIEVVAWVPASADTERFGGFSDSEPSPTTAFAGFGISFGLGKDSSGNPGAILTFNTALDAANPLSSDNFDLLQPFRNDFTLNRNALELVSGSKARVKQSTQGNTKTLLFMEDDLNGDEQLIATHRLTYVPAANGSDPGIIHTEERNNQIRTKGYYGKSTNAGKTWRVMAADGTITEGIKTVFDSVPGHPDERYEQLEVKKLEINLEVLISRTRKFYRRFAWGEELMSEEETVLNDNKSEESRTTSYAYYTEPIGGKSGLRKWVIRPDGSWEKYDYNSTTGALFRTYRPWLNSVSNPANATFENSAVTTYAHSNPTNAWEFECIQGKVVSRTWKVQEMTETDPLYSATSWAHGSPVWEAPAFHTTDANGATVSLGDLVSNASRLVVRFSNGRVKWMNMGHPSIQGRVSTALSQALGCTVTYDAIKETYEVKALDFLEGQAQENGTFSSLQVEKMELQSMQEYASMTPGSVTIKCLNGDAGAIYQPNWMQTGAGPALPFNNYWLYYHTSASGGLPTWSDENYYPFVPTIHGVVFFGNAASKAQQLAAFVNTPTDQPTTAMISPPSEFSPAIFSNGLSPWGGHATISPTHPDTVTIQLNYAVTPSHYEPFRIIPADDNPAYKIVSYNYGTPARFAWAKVASSSWRARSTQVDVSELGDEVLTDLMFGWEPQLHEVQRSQTFTADYKLWNGQMSVYAAPLNGVVTDQLKYSVSSDGRVTAYNYKQGLYYQGTNSFNWDLVGGAKRTTTRTFACNPETLEFLAEDPVRHVTMQDYEGRTRIEEIWKGSDLVTRKLNDYDVATGELVSTEEDGVVTFSAARDIASNTYTTTDSQGIQNLTQYTTDGRVDYTQKLGHGGRSTIKQYTVESGLTTTSFTEAGNLRRQSSSTVNYLGQVVSSTDEEGRTTTYTYEDHGRKVTEHLPNGGTRITERYLDGRLKSITGTAVIPEFHDYMATDEGDIVETVYLNDTGAGSTRSVRWRKTWTNGIGQIVREETPAPGSTATLVTTHTYNTRGQRVSSKLGTQPAQRSSYDVFGRVKAQGIDLDADGALDLDGTEPVTQTKTETVQIGGSWWEKTTVTELANPQTGQPVRTRSTRRLLSGSLYNVTVTEDSDGLVLTDMSVNDPAAKTVTQTRTSNRSGLSAVQVTVNGLMMQAGSLEGTGWTEYDYDALERPTVTLGADGIAHKTVYADVADPEDAAFTLARQRVQKVQVRPAGAADFSDWESYTYHPDGGPGAGQVHVTTRADASTVTQLYDIHGRQTFVSGTGTYPLRYEYNGFGELEKMHTFRSGTPTASSVGDVTVWERDPASGALMSKTDALNHGTVHAYEPATGRLESRTWARSVDGVRVKATYGYDNAGRLETITYNDGTPGVTHTYHPDGRPKTTLDAAGLHTFIYAGPNGALSGETISGGLLAGAVISYGHDAQKRRDQVTWTWGSGQSRTTGLTFDTAGRLHTVSAFGQTATYGYEPGTGRLDTLAYTGTGSLTGSWDYDERGRLDVVSWLRGVDTVSRHDYGYATAMNRRTTALRETGDEWRYGYNLRGEVETAAKAQGTAANAPLWKGLINGYGYDGIGNRTTETVDTPTGTETLDWTPNAVNQITEREVARGKWVLGRVHPEASLTAKKDGVDLPNGSVVREGEEFAVPTEADLAAGQPAWKELSITASRAGVGKNGGNVQQTQTGSLWFAASPESLTYDEDGNLETDGRWLYLCDAENRLKAMETQASAITAGVPAMRLEFAYDAQGRRIRKALFQLETLNLQPGTWVLKSDLRYLYDGWNLIAEFEKHSPSLPLSQSPRLLRAYAWGRDLSGTQQGAGGVGGLVLTQSLSSNRNPPSSSTLAPAYDGNGNITAYLDLANGRLTARLDYDAFGKPVWSELSSTVGAGERIPFGFSTKYEDFETGLLYYGYRYYAPELGRWLSRDPIEEQGGINLYGMVGNDPVNKNDLLGLWTITRDSTKDTAKACADSGDTIKSLASKLGLSEHEAKTWLKPHSSNVTSGNSFEIPNLVIAYWAGDAGKFGKGWVDWDGSIKHLKKLGFKVDEKSHIPGTAGSLVSSLTRDTAAAKVHGVYFWGHGFAPYPSSGLAHKSGDSIFNYTADAGALRYKLALALLFACDSNTGKTTFSTGTAGSIWKGYSGTLYPIWRNFSVSNFIKAGDQGTLK